MDFDAHLRETARHLVWMAGMPMAVDHAKVREQELMASHPMYATLPDLIREIRRASASPFPSAPAAAKTTASTGRQGRGA